MCARSCWRISSLVIGPVFSLAVLGVLSLVRGVPPTSTLVAFGVVLAAWMFSEALHLRRERALQAAAPEDATSEQIARAQALLVESLANLRECFVALDTTPSGPEREAVRARAMIALQSEDTVSQLLGHARVRAQRLEEAAEALDNLTQEILFDSPGPPREPERQARLEARLNEAERTLAELGSLRQPVRQQAVSEGPVQLF